jgi:hypothetical protein
MRELLRRNNPDSFGRAFAQGGAKVVVLCLRRKEGMKQTKKTNKKW